MKATLSHSAYMEAVDGAKVELRLVQKEVNRLEREIARIEREERTKEQRI